MAECFKAEEITLEKWQVTVIECHKLTCYILNIEMYDSNALDYGPLVLRKSRISRIFKS